MSLERLQALLAEERAAALCADLDTLERVQEEKAALVDALSVTREGDVERGVEVERVIASARANVRLLRQLADLHRALVAGEPTYTPRGSLAVEAPDEAAVPRVRRSL